jgi:hypothetical protein
MSRCLPLLLLCPTLLSRQTTADWVRPNSVGPHYSTNARAYILRITDRSKVVILTQPTAKGVPYAAYECKASTMSPFTACIRAAGYWSADEMKAVKAGGGKFILSQGGYGRFKDASGKYSPSLYYNWLQSLKSYAPAWAPYIADGTLLGAQVIDDRGASHWGGVAITNAQIDQMARWWKELAPGITTFVAGGYATDLVGYTYSALDGSINQYNAGYMGDVTAWRDKQVAAAKSAKTSLILSLNILDGGRIVYGCAHPSSGTKCAMTPTEIRTYGTAVAAASGLCGFASWKQQDAYESVAGVTEALRYMTSLANQYPHTSCKRR